MNKEAMPDTDRKRAEEIVFDFPDYGITEEHKLSLINAVVAFASEVRREQRERDAIH